MANSYEQPSGVAAALVTRLEDDVSAQFPHLLDTAEQAALANTAVDGHLGSTVQSIDRTSASLAAILTETAKVEAAMTGANQTAQEIDVAILALGELVTKYLGFASSATQPAKNIAHLAQQAQKDIRAQTDTQDARTQNAAAQTAADTLARGVQPVNTGIGLAFVGVEQIGCPNDPYVATARGDLHNALDTSQAANDSAAEAALASDSCGTELTALADVQDNFTSILATIAAAATRTHDLLVTAAATLRGGTQRHLERVATSITTANASVTSAADFPSLPVAVRAASTMLDNISTCANFALTENRTAGDQTAQTVSSLNSTAANVASAKSALEEFIANSRT